jgi:hypothetical protein
MRVYRARDALQ